MTKAKPDYQMLVERIDAVEALLQRVLASLPQPPPTSFGGAGGYVLPTPCPHGSCAMCGKCVPVFGCPVYNCPAQGYRP